VPHGGAGLGCGGIKNGTGARREGARRQSVIEGYSRLRAMITFWMWLVPS
jgi:hypothetical protein